MKIIITGGGCFLGQRGARELLERDKVNDADGRPQPIRKLVLVDIAQPPKGLSDAKVRYAIGDAADQNSIPETFGDETDGLFHLAGGETSSAAVERVGVLRIGPTIDPGVPWTFSLDKDPLALALKSGNFGAPDFFTSAFNKLPT
jgi:uncharacterized protein YgbK (DUF1537 family)